MMLQAALAVAAALAIGAAGVAAADGIPAWIKNNAEWWATGQIDDRVFVESIRYLISEDIIRVSAVSSGDGSDDIPQWVKNTAGWWASGDITDGDFLNGLTYLVENGIIMIGADEQSDPELDRLRADLAACSEMANAYKRIGCEEAASGAITVYEYKQNGIPTTVGQVVYYWMGMDSEGNSFEQSTGGQNILSIRMLAENTGGDPVSLSCTSPQICGYDVWNGDAAFKYSSMDFTSGQILLKPGESKEFNMLFGPNIGYGGTQFVYDPSKSYYFRISEPFGRAQIALDLQ